MSKLLVEFNVKKLILEDEHDPFDEYGEVQITCTIHDKIIKYTRYTNGRNGVSFCNYDYDGNYSIFFNQDLKHQRKFLETNIDYLEDRYKQTIETLIEYSRELRNIKRRINMLCVYQHVLKSSLFQIRTPFLKTKENSISVMTTFPSERPIETIKLVNSELVDARTNEKMVHGKLYSMKDFDVPNCSDLIFDIENISIDAFSEVKVINKNETVIKIFKKGDSDG